MRQQRQRHIRWNGNLHWEDRSFDRFVASGQVVILSMSILMHGKGRKAFIIHHKLRSMLAEIMSKTSITLLPW